MQTINQLLSEMNDLKEEFMYLVDQKEIKGPVILLFDKIVSSINTLQKLRIERLEKEQEEYEEILDSFVDKHISSI